MGPDTNAIMVICSSAQSVGPDSNAVAIINAIIAATMKTDYHINIYILISLAAKDDLPFYCIYLHVFVLSTDINFILSFLKLLFQSVLTAMKTRTPCTFS